MSIKCDIANRTRIGIRPLETACINLVIIKSMIHVPEALHFYISSDDDNKNGEYLDEYKNKTGERKVLVVAQDVLHCSSHGRIKFLNTLV